MSTEATVSSGTSNGAAPRGARLNWRKPLILGLLKAKRSAVPQELALLRRIERDAAAIRALHEQRLAALLRHAWRHTDYYREVLEAAGVVVDGGVRLERFDRIPILTKEIIRREGERLRARTLPAGRKTYSNRTGGSTGEPTVYWQDSRYWDVNVATKLYHFQQHGKELGELEMKVWGSDRDIVHDTAGWATKAQAFLYNREVRTCARLSDEQAEAILADVDRLRPRAIWGYTDGIYTLARYMLRTGRTVHPPAALFGGGGTLFPPMRAAIEQAFRASMVDMYGSREMGDVACECEARRGLHISSHSHRVEVLDEHERPVIDGDGDLVVTSLHNYAMPFIRYRIGDRGRLTERTCSCGRGFPLLDSLHGRSMESFVTADGAVVSPVYLITAIGTALDPRAVRKFQLVQEAPARVTLKAILQPDADGEIVRASFATAKEKLRAVMGPDCVVAEELVTDIPATASGKYLYTVCNVRAPL